MSCASFHRSGQGCQGGGLADLEITSLGTIDVTGDAETGFQLDLSSAGERQAATETFGKLASDGSDGAIVFAADTTLTRDMFWSSVVATGFVITRPCLRVFAGVITGGTWISDGNDAVGSTGGAAAAAGTLAANAAGGNGQVAAGAAGGNATAVVLPDGGTLGNAYAGGTGGAGSGGAGGAAGSRTPISTARGSIRGGAPMLAGVSVVGPASVAPTGGAGGGGGGGNGAAAGGGGGASGAPQFTLAGRINNATFRARAGNGANASNANTGGGAGGGGGLVYVVTSEYVNVTVSAPGGLGGAGNGTGTAGAAGQAGVAKIVGEDLS